MQGVAAVPATGERHYTITAGIAAVSLHQRENLFLRLSLVAQFIVPAIVAKPYPVEIDEGHGLRQDAPRAASQLRHVAFQQSVFSMVHPELWNQVVTVDHVITDIQRDRGNGNVQDARVAPDLVDLVADNLRQGVTFRSEKDLR